MQRRNNQEQSKSHYVDNKQFFAAMVEYNAKIIEADNNDDPRPRIPDYIGDCFMKIATHLSYKPNFINYTYRDDMISDGLENAVLCINNFDPEKSKNPFAYFTQVIYFAFIRRIQKEKRQMYIRHKVIENSVVQGTTVTSDSNDTSNPDYIDLNNDYMNNFVSNYEKSMAEKKEATTIRQKKKGLENFYEDDKEQ